MRALLLLDAVLLAVIYAFVPDGDKPAVIGGAVAILALVMLLDKFTDERAA